MIENAFGHLKGRRRCLLKWIDLHVSNIPDIVATCVILDKICELCDDHCLAEWIVSNNTTPPILSPSSYYLSKSHP